MGNQKESGGRCKFLRGKKFDGILLRNNCLFSLFYCTQRYTLSGPPTEIGLTAGKPSRLSDCSSLSSFPQTVLLKASQCSKFWLIVSLVWKLISSCNYESYSTPGARWLSPVLPCANLEYVHWGGWVEEWAPFPTFTALTPNCRFVCRRDGKTVGSIQWKRKEERRKWKNALLFFKHTPFCLYRWGLY